MSKGSLIYNNWLLGGIAALLLIAAAIVATYQGGMAVEMGGLQMTLAPHENGGIQLSMMRAA
ncbi:hypothetical protein [Hyphomonas johnsonii]|jgi:hypothetical protein|uniref:Uncharacterized protein n=1 Tax=Hyphomonas johnsonii MHS-2 TaxID=1280950 RepID=A0A059FNX6_9PROT|nr:hypothetical protein [Hyphomonas johnsonii]KCZ92375.1 hypothetical protein HJO_10079 [Hyphomonas johnsonii MHS-2]